MRIPPIQKVSLVLAIALSASWANAQTLQVTLSPTDYNGYHISCFGAKDGAIDATVSGGTPPYTYAWSNGGTAEDIADLPSGYYKIQVSDAASVTADAEITLIEPNEMKLSAALTQYPNGHNISCYECFNGGIDMAVQHGVAPYSYAWDDGPSTEDRSGLGSSKYIVKVTDANGCELVSETMLLTQPDRDDWTMQGNSGSDPAQHFFGSVDEKDVVFKSNNAERIRLLSNGGISSSAKRASRTALPRCRRHFEDRRLQRRPAALSRPGLPPAAHLSVLAQQRQQLPGQPVPERGAHPGHAHGASATCVHQRH
ncbi:MAG: SprB repeat-containing protein [Flavobacteriales bacterium]|nr:SprB repeat-containing protein [Flavobacteriales bacterium]